LTKFEAILRRGYFPKELPPAFHTNSFAKYAASKNGRQVIEAYKAQDNYTECVKYLLALPGGHRRELSIPHPASYARIVKLVSSNFSRLMASASRSRFATSRPVFTPNQRRAFHPAISPSELGSERSLRRAGAAFLLKADISQFYPSLYTHAVGWAVDPKLREKANWKNQKLLGKKLDQALMDLDGKVSQGIPIGGDVFFLLAECVLSRIDARLPVVPRRAYRWFDDYELAFETREELDRCLRSLNRELGKFRLRLNQAKTKILALPLPAEEEWQQRLVQTGGRSSIDSRAMVKHFDTAFRLREQFPDSPVLLYALGVLFAVSCPSAKSGRIAQSCLSQAVLSEPGAAQKGFALLSYWRANGFAIDTELIQQTINRLILRHEAGGVTSDVAWALSFCIEQHSPLPSASAKVLSIAEDDCIALQALHMWNIGLLPQGFSTSAISKLIQSADLDRDHWLLTYESSRQSFLQAAPAITTNSLFADMLAKQVSFYRTSVPSYASVIHPGGAPDWLLRRWVGQTLAPEAPDSAIGSGSAPSIPAEIERDISLSRGPGPASDDALAFIMSLLDIERPGQVLDVSYPV
jgi:hypothetical protein